jgi:hypothetical protein
MAGADTVQKPPSRKTHNKKTAEKATLPPYTPGTLSPMPLEMVPAVPPQVAYAGGQLTIVAHNSTLGDILRAVHNQTGAELDIPSNATERVVATLGPGPARDVLATLLNGTHFNYVMLGSPSNPTAVQRVVLTAKTGPETAATAAGGPVPPQGMPPNRFQQAMNIQQQQQQNVDQQDPPADDNTADAQDDSNTDNSAEEQTDQQQAQPGQAPKTPEQLLQELQRQQQQIQQQGQPGQPGQPQIVYPNPPTGQAPENQN